MRLLYFSLLRVGMPILFTRPVSTADQSRTSALPCMDPTSQPELQINNDCPSSLTDLSTCLQSKSYKENCIAYCEQFLYWFLGPEVPFPNSNCQANEPCTFTGANSLAITNTYSFSAGLAGTGTDLFRLAFNLGSSYTYSTTTTKTQTFTQTRPSNSTGCGYWTFLPYYVTSCGFYINSTKHSENRWGSNFFGESSHSCDSSHDTVFGCTNTTFTDQNGEPEGDVVFINTNCTSNEHLLQGQDPRYSSVFDDDREVVLSVYISDSDSNSTQTERNDPVGDETCFRACLCGYTWDARGFLSGAIFAPYQACNCGLILGKYYALQIFDIFPEYIYLTSANITLLKFYGAVPCDAGVGQSGHFLGDFAQTGVGFQAEWEWVPDNDSMMAPLKPNTSEVLPTNSSIADVVVKNSYECFESFDNIQPVIVNYINVSLGGIFFPEGLGGSC